MCGCTDHCIEDGVRLGRDAKVMFEPSMEVARGLREHFREAIDALDVAYGVPCKSETMRVLGELNDGERQKRQVMFGPGNMVCVSYD